MFGSKDANGDNTSQLIVSLDYDLGLELKDTNHPLGHLLIISLLLLIIFTYNSNEKMLPEWQIIFNIICRPNIQSFFNIKKQLECFSGKQLNIQIIHGCCDWLKV